MSQQENDDSAFGGRTRRSAATKNKAWSALMTSKNKPDDDEDDASFTTRSTPKAAPPRKKQKVEKVTKTESPKQPSPEKKQPIVPAQAPRLSAPQTNGTKNTAALDKEQIKNIEKEMFKTYMSNESEEFTDSEDDTMAELLDDEDDEFVAKPKRTYTKRGTAPVRGRGGIKALANPRFVESSQNMVVSRTTESVRIVPRGAPTLRYASSAFPPPNIRENRPLKMVMRPPIKSDGPVFGNGADNIRMPMTISSMSALPNKEIEDINQKYGQRVVSGDSVSKFNGLISGLVGELKNMAEDRERLIRNNQEYMEQMNLSHQAALDIKESRITQLNNYVNKLQSQITQLTLKLQASISQHESSEKDPSPPANEEEE